MATVGQHAEGAAHIDIVYTPSAELLRDVVHAVELKEYMGKFGVVKDFWIPWRKNDKRYFGFASFKDPEVDKTFVSVSPHNLKDVEILVDFKQPKKAVDNEGRF